MTSFSTRAISGPSSVLERSQSTASLSTVQKQVDGLVTDFTAQATDPQTLAALTAGGAALPFR